MSQGNSKWRCIDFSPAAQANCLSRGPRHAPSVTIKNPQPPTCQAAPQGYGKPTAETALPPHPTQMKHE
eukprot:3044053-Amphidinium_carterae.1